MIGQAGETEFDLRFQILGIPVRVHPLFWLMAAFIVWESAEDPKLKVLGIMCVFISILVHELGHAVKGAAQFGRQGIDSFVQQITHWAFLSFSDLWFVTPPMWQFTKLALSS